MTVKVPKMQGKILLLRHPENGVTITINGGNPLNLETSLEVVNHSPTGFEFGYVGSGPAQSALAILLELTKDTEIARIFHQEFKNNFISGSTTDNTLEIQLETVYTWLKNKREQI